MGHSGLKTGVNERKFTAQVFSQHHRVVQPHTTITIAPLRPHTTHTDCHWAWEKHPAKVDHSNLADSDIIVNVCC